MDRFFITSAVFFGIYSILKNFTDFLLKRKIIKEGHFDEAKILNQKVMSSTAGNEPEKYPSLKWGLVAFFSGLGLILVDKFRPMDISANVYYSDRVLPFGIVLTFIALGFIVYFLIVTAITKKDK